MRFVVSHPMEIPCIQERHCSSLSSWGGGGGEGSAAGWTMVFNWLFLSIKFTIHFMKVIFNFNTMSLFQVDIPNYVVINKDIVQSPVFFVSVSLMHN